ncbi:glycosyltransferase [Massilia sp.]|uniref:glycosyltransferase n=1 Tax=Massilia sp. TaxID=1882437 RepID=UPI00352BD328
MRVLFVINGGYLPESVGGSEWSLHHFAIGLQQRGHEVAVLATQNNAGWTGLRNRVVSRVLRRAFPVDHHMGYPCFRGQDIALGLLESFARFNPDVLFAAGTGSGSVALCQQALQMGIKVIYSVKDVWFPGHGNLSSLEGALFVTNSLFTAKRLYDTFGLSSTVVRPPIDSQRCKVPVPGDKVVLVNPYESKGGPLALAMAQARKDIPFAFYESWSVDLTAIKKQAMASGNIDWHRSVLDPRKIYRNARILLVPSQAEEAWGMVASEAQCSGIPVIGSEIGGLSEAIGPGGIRLAHNAPLSEWLGALDRIWHDQREWQRLSNAALTHAQRHEIQVATQIDLLDNLLESGFRERGRAFVGSTGAA